MKKLMTVLMLCSILLVPAMIRAHEGHLHNALGTVASVELPHVNLKTTDGKTLMVMLDKETSVTRGKPKVDPSALKVGERISVDYMEEKGMNMVHAIKLAAEKK